VLSSDGTDSLVALENDAPEVLFELMPGTDLPIWPFVRNSIAQATAAAELGAERVAPSLTRIGMAVDLARGLTPWPRSSDTLRGRATTAFFVSGNNVSRGEHGLENELVDDYAEDAAGSVVVQVRPVPRGSRRIRSTRDLESVYARADLARKLRPVPAEHLERALAAVRGMVDAVDFPLGDDARASIESDAAARLSVLPHRAASLGALVSRLSPRVAVVEDASYGSAALLVTLLKRAGATVIEPQHGWIGPSHGAYNFGAAMSAAPLSESLPDVLATFGEFWGEEIRHPARVVAVGKPHLEARAASQVPLGQRPKRILIASSVVDAEGTEDFTLRLRAAIDHDFELVFRPHPLERATVAERYPRLAAAAGVSFDANADVHTSLLESRAIVGVASTVLYEALAFGCHVFARESTFAEYYLAPFFGDLVAGDAGISRMVTTILNSDAPSVSAGVLDSIWKTGGRENFAALLLEASASP
jgi:hypothetical protein